MNMQTQRTHQQPEANVKHVPCQLLTKFLVLARVLEAVGVQVCVLLVAMLSPGALSTSLLHPWKRSMEHLSRLS